MFNENNTQWSGRPDRSGGRPRRGGPGHDHGGHFRGAPFDVTDGASVVVTCERPYSFARRAAAKRLSTDPGTDGALERGVASEPGFDLPGTAAIGGRGARRGQRDRDGENLRLDPRGPDVGREQREQLGKPWEDADGGVMVRPGNSWAPRDSWYWPRARS